MSISRKRKATQCAVREKKSEKRKTKNRQENLFTFSKRGKKDVFITFNIFGKKILLHKIYDYSFN